MLTNITNPTAQKDHKNFAESKILSLVRRVCIPAVIMDEIDAAGLHGLAKDVVYWIIYRCTTTRARSCAIHQGLLDDSIGSTARKQVMEFIHRSAYIRAASAGLYRPGRQCKRYELTGVTITGECHQHNNGSGVSDGDIALVVGDVVWRSVDFGDLLGRIFLGFEKRGWNRSVRNAEWSLSNIDQPTLTESEVVDVVGDDQRAKQHAAAFGRYGDKLLDGIFRKNGRLYSSVTSLPRWIREREVTFSGESESLDISCCYLWVLAAEHRVSRVRRGLDTTEIDSLMTLIEAGDFYHRIAEIAGVETTTAKADFNQFCFFGPVGWHPLWQALRTISPGICRDIRWWRSQPGGSTRLAHYLQRAEGELMLDGVIDWLVSGGIPAVGIHDGCIVPAGVAEIASEWLRDRSRELYGRSCRVKVTRSTGGVS